MKRATGAVLRWGKTIAARFMLVIEFCHECGRRQPLVWHADDELWKQVTGGVDGAGAPLCPECFDARARKMGLLAHWTASLREFEPRG